MKYFSLLLLSLFLVLPGKNLLAQRVEAEAVLLKDQIKIGEQCELKLAVRYREGSAKAKVHWPELHDTITNGVDIVKLDTIKTTMASRASVLYEQSRLITLTAFDSGMYVIPSQTFIVDDDTVSTEALQLYVSTVPVDTTKPIKDIKGIYDVPAAPPAPEQKSSVPLWLWFLIGFVVLAVIGVIIYFVTRKKAPAVEVAPERQLLPHEKVLERLARLGRHQPWLKGELELYHIELTTILREWIIERFRIHAKEMTSAEIIATLKGLRCDANALAELQSLFHMADLVKFGKQLPGNEENERCLQQAIRFVQATPIYPQAPAETPLAS